MAIDFTNKETLITVKIALIRALNSLDNEIAENIEGAAIAYLSERHYYANKLELLNKSRADMTAIYNEMDKVIDDTLTFFPNVHY